jgi:hypothetical protein
VCGWLNALDLPSRFWQALNVLRQRLTKKGVQLIIAHIPPTRLYIHRLLVAHGVAAGGTIHRGPPSDAEAAAASQTATCLVFDSLSSGLQYCEEALLSTAVQYGACPVSFPPLSYHCPTQLYPFWLCFVIFLLCAPLRVTIYLLSQAHEDSISLRAILEANRSLEWRERPLLPGENKHCHLALSPSPLHPLLSTTAFLKLYRKFKHILYIFETFQDLPTPI